MGKVKKSHAGNRENARMVLCYFLVVVHWRRFKLTFVHHLSLSEFHRERFLILLCLGRTDRLTYYVKKKINFLFIILSNIDDA